MARAAKELIAHLPSLRAASAESKRLDASKKTSTLEERLSAWRAKEAAEARAAPAREFLQRMSTLSKYHTQYAPEELGYEGVWELGYRGIFY